jgi:hypothetical protein
MVGNGEKTSKKEMKVKILNCKDIGICTTTEKIICSGLKLSSVVVSEQADYPGLSIMLLEPLLTIDISSGSCCEPLLM